MSRSASACARCSSVSLAPALTGTPTTTRACDLRVNDHERVREDEQRVGRGDRARRRVGQSLDVPRDVVREKSDGSAPEGAELRHIDGLVLRDAQLQVRKRVGRRACAVPALGRRPILGNAVLQAPGRARLGAHEGVARPRLATGRRGLEQECERAASQLGKRGDGGLGVEQAVSPHGNEPTTLRERLEAVERGHVNVVT